MAFVELAAPTGGTTPAAGTDYQKQNALIAAAYLGQERVQPVDFDNNLIPKGVIINLGGTIYLNDADLSITGTPSNFVKVDHTTLAASYVSSLSGVTWSNVYNGYYASSNLYLFDEMTAIFNGDVTVSKTVMGLIRKAVFSEISVELPNWTYAMQLNAELNISGSGVPALAALNSTDVAFIDSTLGNLSVYRWSGSAWSLVGTPLNIAGISSYVALAALNSTDVAFIEATLENLSVYRWSGSTWSLVGTPLNIAGAGPPALAALNSTDVAFIDSDLKNLSVYRWSGSAWSLVGTPLNISGINLPALAALNSTDVAFIDLALKNLSVYRWSGSAWSLVGTPLNISGINLPALAALNSTDVAFSDSALENLSVYRWSRSTWSLVGTPLNIAGIGTPALAALNSTDVAFMDNTLDNLTTYHFINEPKVS